MNLTALKDEELVQKFLKGSNECFEELVSRYETKAYNLAMRLTRNQEDAEEVLQDVFVTVYRKLSGFEGKSKFSSWLYRVTANAAFMKLRKRRTERAVPTDDIHTVILAQGRVEQSLNFEADSRANAQELRDALGKAIGRLPDDYRAVFVLRDIDGLSNKEVSDILGLTIPAVKSRLHRSRLMLRRRLKKIYESIGDAMQEIANPPRSQQAPLKAAWTTSVV